jgi:Zn finger protein HypA/HybF involved in hydrogenase expression
MSIARQGPAGTTRSCPHCRATILESAAVCPACKHHLRFDPGAAQRAQPSLVPLKVEGTIKHPAVGESWEYSVMVSIRNEKGEEITRKVVGVGALQPAEQRTFTLAVEVFKDGKRAGGRDT